MNQSYPAAGLPPSMVGQLTGAQQAQSPYQTASDRWYRARERLAQAERSRECALKEFAIAADAEKTAWLALQEVAGRGEPKPEPAFTDQ